MNWSWVHFLRIFKRESLTGNALIGATGNGVPIFLVLRIIERADPSNAI